jgi:hypothetical protein
MLEYTLARNRAKGNRGTKVPQADKLTVRGPLVLVLAWTLATTALSGGCIRTSHGSDRQPHRASATMVQDGIGVR